MKFVMNESDMSEIDLIDPNEVVLFRCPVCNTLLSFDDLEEAIHCPVCFTDLSDILGEVN